MQDEPAPFISLIHPFPEYMCVSINIYPPTSSSSPQRFVLPRVRKGFFVLFCFEKVLYLIAKI